MGCEAGGKGGADVRVTRQGAMVEGRWVTVCGPGESPVKGVCLELRQLDLWLWYMDSRCLMLGLWD